MLLLSTAIAVSGFGENNCEGQGNKSLITLATLLDEMTDVSSDPCFPSPFYTAKQLTSYDRRSLKPGTQYWHSNDDWSGFVKLEDNNGRLEKVLFEENGPGVITRIVTTGGSKDSNIRIYFDDEPEASILIHGYDISKFPVAIPPGLIYFHEHYKSTQGCSFYYPIPYSKKCKITVDNVNRGYVYHINYRTYKKGTIVKTFTIENAIAVQSKAAKISEKLQKPVYKGGLRTDSTRELVPNSSLKLILPAGSKAIRTLKFSVTDYNKKEFEQLLRGLIVKIAFDHVQTVSAPLSDFSGAGMGAPEFNSYYLSSDGAGIFIIRFVMPYKEEAEIELYNLTMYKATASISAYTEDWHWKSNTLYFHATWRQETGLKTNIGLDYNMASISGRGLFKGDVLSLYNHTPRWYGEGDEHIWVDGESFPSHFGCGTEDYYNTTYAPFHIYSNPFGGSPREDNEDSRGYNTFVRTRNLDVIPFKNNFKFDFELISWDTGIVDYASTVFWYGDINSKSLNPSADEDALNILPPV